MKTQRGIALVLVLWMVVLLAVIAGALGTTSRSGVAMITNLRQEHQARALVEAGLRFMMLQLAWRNLPVEDNPWPADGRLHPWDFAGQRIWIGAQPENARLGLNVVDEKQLGRLLQALGLPDEQAEALRDAILDWRDADDGRRPQGAEDEDYRAAGRPLGARDGPFPAVEELRQVLGMNDAIYARLAPMLTLYNGQRTVNPAFAPRELLLSAPGMDETLVDQYLAARDQARRQGEPVPPPPAGGAVLRMIQGTSYRVFAEVDTPCGFKVQGELVVNTQSRTPHGYRILDRRWGPFEAPPRVAPESDDPAEPR